MGTPLLKFTVVGLLLFSALCAIVSTSNAQHPIGFVSIDCGSNDTRFEDSNTGLIWLNDSNYTKTGLNGLVPSHVDSKLENSNALKSFRYFPYHRSKHCYELRLSTDSVLVLIRAMFFRGNSPGLVMPIQFDVSVNANRWFSVNYDSEDSNSEEPIVREGIFNGSEPITYFCLLPRQGVPFISSLEVRPLDPGGVMYNFDNRDKLYLSTLRRINTGPPADAPTVRYPDDNYDRLWVNAHVYGLTKDVTESDVSSQTTSLKLNSVPMKVMSDGWDPTNEEATSPNGTIYFRWFFNLSFPEVADRAIYLYPIFYFEPSGKYPTGDDFYVTILLNDELLVQQLNVTNATAKDFPHLVLPNNQANFDVLTTSPVISAIEFYEEVINNPSNARNEYNLDEGESTNSDHHEEVHDIPLRLNLWMSAWHFKVGTVNLLKEIYGMEDWQGDPCVPVPYDWLNCQDQNAGTSLLKSISSIALSNLSSKHSLLELSSLDLFSIHNLSLTYSRINDSILDHIIDILPAVFTVNFDHNLITTSELFFNLSRPLTSLSLSHNLLRGEVPSLINTTFSGSLQQLNLSHNTMTSFPLAWGDPPRDFVLTSLTMLDLSYNNISGDISGLSAMVQRNQKLEKLDLSNNLLKGEFPSNLYFNLTHIQTLNIDKNAISGVLDLTIWRDNLLLVLNNSSIKSSANSSSTPNNQVFSFLDNQITGINPSVEGLESVIDFFLQQQDSFLSFQGTPSNGDGLPTFSQSGVLLSGNPFCKSAKSRSHKYLCRFSLDEFIREEKNNSNKTLIILASLGGASLVICSVVVAVVMWKYLRELRLLHSIQYALVKQNVQPRFYLFSDLRHATQDFHESNTLGKGGFGVVYKGILQDGSANGTPIAVKKLFDSAENRVLTEFLNEVVLISGIKHRNLIQLTGCCIKERERILVYELAEGGNVAEALWGKDSVTVLDWNKRYNICVGIARGLAYLHEELQPRIIHRDIKAANVLLDKNFNPKIGDFGLAKPILVEDNKTNFTLHIGGTRGYIAPEHATQGQLTEKSDVFSFGILVLEIISGRKCLDLTLPEDQIYLKTWAEQLNEEGKVLNLLQLELQGKCAEDQVLNLINIALTCVQSNPKSRPKMSEVITMLVGNVDVNSFLHQDQHEPSDLSESFVTLEFDGWSSFDEGPSSGLLASDLLIKTRSSGRLQQSTSKGGSLQLSDMSGR